MLRSTTHVRAQIDRRVDVGFGELIPSTFGLNPPSMRDRTADRKEPSRERTPTFEVIDLFVDDQKYVLHCIQNLVALDP